jgi:Dolichyl-phosphate-mannose-protein mannosyltransferase
VISCTAFPGAGHLDETTTFDIVAWTTILWLVAGLLRGADPRRWLAVGIVAGIGLENKDLLFLGAALMVGLVIARRWDVFRSRWAWAAIGLAVLIWLPNLAWQATNGWPQVTMAGRISSGSGMENRVELLPFQLLLGGAFLAPVLVAGFLWLGRSVEGRSWRAFAWAYAVLLVLLFAGGGKGYYAAGFFGPMMAAGAVRLDGWFDRGRRSLRRAAFGIAAIASAMLVIVVMLPVIPPALLGATFVPTLYRESAEQLGWPELARAVEGVVASLPAADRQGAVILTANYGEAGALSLLGHDLPPVYSGHNSLAAWGPPPERSGPVLLVGYWGRAYREQYFGGCTEAAVFDNELQLDNDEQGASVLVCPTRSMPWAQAWPGLTHIN